MSDFLKVRPIPFAVPGVFSICATHVARPQENAPQGLPKNSARHREAVVVRIFVHARTRARMDFGDVVWEGVWTLAVTIYVLGVVLVPLFLGRGLSCCAHPI